MPTPDLPRRRLADLDWVITPSGGRLHHTSQPDHLAEQLEDNGYLDSLATGGYTVGLDCGRQAARVDIPGVLSRMSVPRCARCCTATGMPRGLGSPRNDPACQALLGLNEETSHAT